MENDDAGTRAWQQWRSLYAIVRNAAFQRLLEARLTHSAETSMKQTKLLSNSPACVIELTHGTDDPGMWIVRHATRYMWFKKRVSSHWFNSEPQAMAFAEELKQKHATA